MTTQPLAGQIREWPDVRDTVEANTGIYMLSMETLRQLEGAQRLGPNVLSSIESRLQTLGLEHLPRELPNRGNENVVLYQRGTPADSVIRAVRWDASNVGAYEALWRVNATPDPGNVIPVQELRPAAEKLLELMSRGSKLTIQESDVVDAELIPMLRPAQ